LNDLIIRPEEPRDFATIHDLTSRAFAPMPFCDGNEQNIIVELRCVGALTRSIVAEQGGRMVGHAAFSPAFADDGSDGWYALGPISVEPSLQRQGIGTKLIRHGIDELRALSAAGCAVIGDPAYYPRHGFRLFPNLAPENEPAEYFMIMPLRVEVPTARMRFHPAFYGKYMVFPQAKIMSVSGF
jgi:putative acetyltransferase